MPTQPLLFLATLLTAPCPIGTAIEGLDVSEFNGPVDWAAVADAGIQFAFAKATEGLTLRDRQFEENWGGMQASGLTRGAYHFFHPADDGTAQAGRFLSEVGVLGPGDLPPVLDWETSDDRTVEEAIASAQAFIAEVARQTGQATIIYTYRSYWDSLGAPASLAGNPLWLASYEQACPVVPAPWNAWQFWQYTDSASIPGVVGPVDRDRFAGDLNSLRTLGAPSELFTTPTPPLQGRTGCGGECLWPACAIALVRKRPRAANPASPSGAAPNAPNRPAAPESRQ